jgi:acetyl-CoA C-acetyltransferase
MTAARLDPRQAVLVGTGQINWSSGDAPDPIELIAEAARRAVTDSSVARLIQTVTSVRVVRMLTRGYPDPGALVADRLGLSAATHTVYTTDGGQTPQALVHQACEQLAGGWEGAILLAGGECWKTRAHMRAQGVSAPWARQSSDSRPAERFGSPLEMTSPEETALGFTDPTQAYPMFEHALRRRSGTTIAEQTRLAAELWARFSEVAAMNPNAALPLARTADEIATTGPANRMIASPYPKLMNSNSSVDQAAALLLCSVEHALSLGIPSERWVFLHGGGEANDVQYVTDRWDLTRSPAIRAAGAAALRLSGTSADDVAHVDLYSCFPSAVQVAASELGLSLDRPLTVTGGLTFAGGPWNAYVLFSIATMAGVLRDHPDDLGLISANGGLLTKHAIGVYGCRPPKHGARIERPTVDGARRVAAYGYRGPVTVDAYTVMHDRHGAAERAYLSCLLDDGRRTMAVSSQSSVLQAAAGDEFLGSRLEL